MVSEKGSDSGTQSSQQFFASNYIEKYLTLCKLNYRTESCLISKVLAPKYLIEKIVFLKCYVHKNLKYP